MELVSTLKTLFFFYFYQTFSVETQSDYYNYGYLSALNSVVSLNEKKITSMIEVMILSHKLAHIRLI